MDQPANDASGEINAFHDILRQLMSALLDFTVDDVDTHEIIMKQQTAYNAVMSTRREDWAPKMIERFHNECGQYYANVDQGDLSFIPQVDLLKRLQLDGILRMADAEAQESLCAYLKHLVAQARLWHVKTSGFVSKCSQVSMSSLRFLQTMGNPEDGSKVEMPDMSELIGLLKDPRFTDMMQGIQGQIQGGAQKGAK